MTRLIATTAVLLVLAVASNAVSAQSPPSACNQVLGSCAGDISKAFSALGVSSPAELRKVGQDKIQAFTNNPANKPSPGCCKAACEGNRQNCNCYAAVQDQIKGIVGGDLDLYNQLLAVVSTSCGFTSIQGGSCPADITKITAPACT